LLYDILAMDPEVMGGYGLLFPLVPNGIKKDQQIQPSDITADSLRESVRYNF
jgi:hypothetical protein